MHFHFIDSVMVVCGLAGSPDAHREQLVIVVPGKVGCG
jgi:hypothetical protein